MLKLLKFFKNYFNKVVGNVDKTEIWNAFESHSTKIPFWYQLTKMLLILLLKNIKSRMNSINSNFSFEFVDQDQVFKEI